MPFERGANPIRVRVNNQSAILRTIYRWGPIKRAEIAEHLGLTLPTITTNVNNMIASGIVRETSANGLDLGFVGRKAHPIDIVPESRHFIGIEMQGAWRAICLMDYRGKVLYARRDETLCRDYDQNIHLISTMIGQVLANCGLNLGQIAGIGVCTPGLVSTGRGTLEMRPSYSWFHKDLRRDVSQAADYDGPIIVENNACARTYGAQLFQRDMIENVQTFAYLFISDGIACPLVLNRSNTFGSIVGVGEAGHMIIDPGGPLCSCGNRGCLEAYSSDQAILGSCMAVLERGEAPVLMKLCGSRPPDMEAVVEAQTAGDGGVGQVVEGAIHTLGTAVVNIIHFACPDVLLIEGKLFRNPNNRSYLEEAVRSRLCSTVRDSTEFIFVEPDGLGGAKGAAAMAICKNLETYIA